MYNVDGEKVFWREIEGEIVILNIDNGFYYTLDEVGSIIWEMVVKNISEEQIVKNLVEGYETDKATASKDVKTFLRELEKQEIIKIL